jgi:hypothetical protein
MLTLKPDLRVNQAAPRQLPCDLSRWLGKRVLACLVLEAATESGSAIFRFHPSASDTSAPRPQTLLALLTYCYATGIYASSEIEFQRSQDAMINYLAASSHPDANRLRLFRRHWRPVIKQSLVKLFQLIWQHRFNETPADNGASACGDGVCGTAKRDGEWNRLFVAEAEARIDRAVQLDCMYADE